MSVYRVSLYFSMYLVQSVAFCPTYSYVNFLVSDDHITPEYAHSTPVSPWPPTLPWLKHGAEVKIVSKMGITRLAFVDKWENLPSAWLMKSLKKAKCAVTSLPQQSSVTQDVYWEWGALGPSCQALVQFLNFYFLEASQQKLLVSRDTWHVAH